jgi:hypothetical protein
MYKSAESPRARWRSQVVRHGRPGPDGNALEASPTLPSPARLELASVDAPRVRPRCPRLSPRCGGRRRVIATVQDPLAVQGPPRQPSALWAPEPPGLPHPPRPQSGRHLARSGPRSLTLAPLHPCLDREPAAAQDHWGPAGALDAHPRLRPLDRAVPGPPPGLRGEAGLPRRRPPRGGGVNRSYAPRN